MTLKKYPRTLGEAFKGPSYANPIEGPLDTGYPSDWLRCMLVVSIAALVVVWLTL